MALRATVEELRALYEKSQRTLTRRKRTAHRLRMAYRKAIRRVKRREAITAARKRRLDAAVLGPRERVVKKALSLVGTHEAPGYPNSDRGGVIDRMNRAVGLTPGPWAYWCGSFCHWVLKSGGLDFPDWIRYTPSIYNYARAGQFGLSLVPASQAKPGDMVLFNFDGGVVDHVGIYIGGGETVEGNTSPGTGGSQNNGGGIYKRAPRGTFHYVHIDYDKAPRLQSGVERH